MKNTKQLKTLDRAELQTSNEQVQQSRNSIIVADPQNHNTITDSINIAHVLFRHQHEHSKDPKSYDNYTYTPLVSITSNQNFLFFGFKYK